MANHENKLEISHLQPNIPLSDIASSDQTIPLPLPANRHGNDQKVIYNHEQNSDSRHAISRPPFKVTTQSLLFFLLIMALAFLLASFPARNSDVWTRLAQGKLLSQRNLSPFSDTGHASALQTDHTWLYGLV